MYCNDLAFHLCVLHLCVSLSRCALYITHCFRYNYTRLIADSYGNIFIVYSLHLFLLPTHSVNLYPTLFLNFQTVDLFTSLFSLSLVLMFRKRMSSSSWVPVSLSLTVCSFCCPLNCRVKQKKRISSAPTSLVSDESVNFTESTDTECIDKQLQVSFMGRGTAQPTLQFAYDHLTCFNDTIDNLTLDMLVNLLKTAITSDTVESSFNASHKPTIYIDRLFQRYGNAVFTLNNFPSVSHSCQCVSLFLSSLRTLMCADTLVSLIECLKFLPNESIHCARKPIWSDWLRVMETTWGRWFILCTRINLFISPPLFQL